MASSILLFFSSYTILFIALALRFTCPKWLPIGCWALAAVGLLATVGLLLLPRFFSRDVITIESVEDRGPDVGGYLATYIVPMVVVGTPTTMDLWAFGLILFAMALIFVRSRLIQVNPTLYFFGYRLFEVTTDHGFKGYLLSIEEPTIEERRTVVHFSNILLDMRVWSWYTKLFSRKR